jgi:hypothetical protein
VYKINEKLVVREQDNTLFNAHNFQLYKFNRTGFSILKKIEEGTKNPDTTTDLIDQSNEEIKQFIDKCVKHEILVRR